MTRQFALLAVLALSTPAVAARIPTPKSVFGFEPGDDRKLLDYEQLIAYMQELGRASPRITMQQVGRSPQGRPMFVAFISAPDNLERLDELKAINRRLALDPEIPDAERADLLVTGRVFLMATLSMHSSEVGPSQTLPLLAYELATTRDPAVLSQLDSVVLMVVPCHNPDGMDMVVSYYRKTAGGPFDGGMMPGVYHAYVGHDNNRDFVSLTQADTRVISRLYSTAWYPHVLVEKHQMGRVSPRYFVPPFHDPIAVNIDESLWSWSSVFGANLARDMGKDGLQGVVKQWVFDNYWPGSTETSHWKGVISLLTEAASANVASPVWVERNEIQVRGKGLAEYEKGINMPEPWMGGWWRLGDITTYELSSWRSLLKTAATERLSILESRNDLCRREVQKGRSEPPYYFVLPPEQHDHGALARLTALLLEHGVQLFSLSAETTVAGRVFERGSLVVPLAQPYRAFVKEVLEAQRYPKRRYVPEGDIIQPYDITSWSLPLHWGLASHQVEQRSTELEGRLEPIVEPPTPRRTTLGKDWGLALRATDNDAYLAAFVALERGLRVSRLLEPITANEETLPPGSFLVSGKREALSRLLDVGASAATPLASKPKAKSRPVERPRIGLVETWYHHMDAGWTRYLLDTFHVPYRVLRPGDIPKVDLAQEIDVLLLADADPHILKEGRPGKDASRSYELPPEFAKGIGKKGIKRIVEFIDSGGIVVAWRESTGLFTDEIEIEHDEGRKDTIRLPIRDLAEQRIAKGLLVPGALLNAEIRQGDPLTWGMPSKAGVFARAKPVFQTHIPVFDVDRRVLVHYAKDGLLASGHIEGAEQIAGTPGLVWVRRGKGQLVLFGFHPHFRASTPGTFKLLLNALLLGSAR